MSRELDLAAADLLDRAADYIEQHGWCRNAFDRSGHACAAGAIIQVGGQFADFVEKCALTALRQHVAPDFAGGSLYSPIAEWNDAQKSRKPVLRTLREVAAEVRTRATAGAA